MYKISVVKLLLRINVNESNLNEWCKEKSYLKNDTQPKEDK